MSIQPSIIRLGVLLLLFDVYLTWARMEKQTMPGVDPGASNLGSLARQPIVLQYLFFCIVLPRLRSSMSTLLTRVHSGSLRILDSRFPQQHTLPHFLSLLPAQRNQHPAPLPPTELRLDRPPRLVLYKAISNIDGDMGIRRAGGRALAGLGGRGK